MPVMMKIAFFLVWINSAVSAPFFVPFGKLPSLFPFFSKLSAPKDPVISNICVYSDDPVKYQPKCFPCPNAVYPNVMKSCADAATMPSNVTYVQATCIEQNCKINYAFKRSSADLEPTNRRRREVTDDSTKPVESTSDSLTSPSLLVSPSSASSADPETTNPSLVALRRDIILLAACKNVSLETQKTDGDAPTKLESIGSIDADVDSEPESESDSVSRAYGSKYSRKKRPYFNYFNNYANDSDYPFNPMQSNVAVFLKGLRYKYVPYDVLFGYTGYYQ